METLTREDWYTWRKRLYYLYLFNTFGLGLSFGITFATEFLYIKEILKSSHPVFIYSLGAGLGCVSGVISGILGSIYYDFTFNLKHVLLTCFILSFIGNVLYTLPYSVWFVVVANVLVGCMGIGMTCIGAELTHTYEESELTGALAGLYAIANTGMFLTPCLTFLYQHVDRTFGNWRLTFGNMPALIMSIYLFICLILNIFLDKDLAKMHDLKAEREHETRKRLLTESGDEDDNSVDHDSTPITEQTWPVEASITEQTWPVEAKTTEITWSSLKTYGQTFIGIALERHLGIILLVSAFDLFSSVVGIKLISVRCVVDFGWNAGKVASIRIAAMVSGGLISVAISVLSKRVMDFYMLYATNIIGAIAIIVTSTLPFLRHSATQSAVVYYTSALFLGVAEAGSHIISATMVAKLVQSKFQGIAEAVRVALMFVSVGSAAFMINAAVPYTTVFCSVAVILHAVIGIILLFEHEFYSQKST